MYSLAENRKINEEGVKFQSHIDGSSHFFTPENIIDIQRDIGGDIIMAFDECPPYPCGYNYVKKSINDKINEGSINFKDELNHFKNINAIINPIFGFSRARRFFSKSFKK